MICLQGKLFFSYALRLDGNENPNLKYTLKLHVGLTIDCEMVKTYM